MKNLFLLLGAVTLSLASVSQSNKVFQKNNKAIDGYDAVAFFTAGKAVKGSDTISYRWNDALWLFSSLSNRDSFVLHPGNYAPQYGGYCAYGCSNGYKAPTEIDTWTIVNNKLYFNYNKKVKEAWWPEKDALITKADDQWDLIKDKK